jgi:hypothetical protein
MVLQDLLFHFVEGCAHRIDLREHVNAVSVFVDHTQQPTYLTLDPLQPRGDLVFCSFVHLATIPWQGISGKSWTRVRTTHESIPPPLAGVVRTTLSSPIPSAA